MRFMHSFCKFFWGWFRRGQQLGLGPELVKEKLDKIHKEAKSSDKILQKLGFDTQEEAICVLYEAMSLIEFMWNMMISYETTVLMKDHIQTLKFSLDSSLNLSTLSKFSKPFFRNRSSSYSKLTSVSKFSLSTEPTSKNDYYNFLMSSTNHTKTPSINPLSNRMSLNSLKLTPFEQPNKNKTSDRSVQCKFRDDLPSEITEEIKDKAEECNILREKCKLLDQQRKECESIIKHYQKELKYYKDQEQENFSHSEHELEPESKEEKSNSKLKKIGEIINSMKSQSSKKNFGSKGSIGSQINIGQIIIKQESKHKNSRVLSKRNRRFIKHNQGKNPESLLKKTSKSVKK